MIEEIGKVLLPELFSLCHIPKVNFDSTSSYHIQLVKSLTRLSQIQNSNIASSWCGFKFIYPSFLANSNTALLLAYCRCKKQKPLLLLLCNLIGLQDFMQSAQLVYVQFTRPSPYLFAPPIMRRSGPETRLIYDYHNYIC